MAMLVAVMLTATYAATAVMLAAGFFASFFTAVCFFVAVAVAHAGA